MPFLLGGGNSPALPFAIVVPGAGNSSSIAQAPQQFANRLSITPEMMVVHFGRNHGSIRRVYRHYLPGAIQRTLQENLIGAVIDCEYAMAQRYETDQMLKFMHTTSVVAGKTPQVHQHNVATFHQPWQR